jgi:nitrogen fixation/metabolism regulation signal transduction histidine kinase
VVGSRLEARMVWMSATLAMLPLLLVFYFSVMFLNAASTAGSTSRSAKACKMR